MNIEEQRERLLVDRLIKLFNTTFNDFNTRLVRGQDEPIYLPADHNRVFHQLVFAHGFFSSGLHEIAHWCIAGEQRRALPDYGYWYCPDGRNKQQQLAFEQVEVKPQALEWAFSAACGREFTVSTDNLNGVESNRFDFSLAVKEQLNQYFAFGFPVRAQRFIEACSTEFNPSVLTLADCLSASQEL